MANTAAKSWQCVQKGVRVARRLSNSCKVTLSSNSRSSNSLSSAASNSEEHGISSNHSKDTNGVGLASETPSSGYYSDKPIWQLSTVEVLAAPPYTITYASGKFKNIFCEGAADSAVGAPFGKYLRDIDDFGQWLETVHDMFDEKCAPLALGSKPWSFDRALCGAPFVSFRNYF